MRLRNIILTTSFILLVTLFRYLFIIKEGYKTYPNKLLGFIQCNDRPSFHLHNLLVVYVFVDLSRSMEEIYFTWTFKYLYYIVRYCPHAIEVIVIAVVYTTDFTPIPPTAGYLVLWAIRDICAILLQFLRVLGIRTCRYAVMPT